MTDFADFDFQALEAAKSGNVGPLAQKLRSGEYINGYERAFIADRLEGKVKFKTGPKAQIFVLDCWVAEACIWLTKCRGDKDLHARETIADMIKETEPSVRNRIARSTGNPLATVVINARIALWRRDQIKEVEAPILFGLNEDQITWAKNELTR